MPSTMRHAGWAGLLVVGLVGAM
ncbi:hypothetical protein LCGC14_2772820, partial [marine sediment metagenome]